MRHLLRSPLMLTLAGLLAGCASSVSGDPRPADLPVAALAAPADASPAVAGAIVSDAMVTLALVTGPADAAWFHELREAAGMEAMTRPGTLAPDMGAAFLGLEAVGDTTIELRYGDTTFRVHDALYDLGRQRLVDLLSFRVDSASAARPLVISLTEYVATDVPPGAAVVLAVAVPSAAVGDSVARMLTPMYRGVAHCGADAEVVAGAGVRLFYGPEVRMYCTDARAGASAAGDLVRADLVVGRRR